MPDTGPNRPLLAAGAFSAFAMTAFGIATAANGGGDAPTVIQVAFIVSAIASAVLNGAAAVHVHRRIKRRGG